MEKLPPVGETSVTLTTLNPGGAVTVAVKVFELALKLRVRVPAFMVHLYGDWRRALVNTTCCVAWLEINPHSPVEKSFHSGGDLAAGKFSSVPWTETLVQLPPSTSTRKSTG